MDNKYFLPINSNCLAHYFGCCCIKPSRYFTNKPEDIQNRFDGFLLISSIVVKIETDCCLELILTRDESLELITLNQDFSLYPKPLPITRVKRIIFFDAIQKEQTIANLNMSTAFVPSELVEVIDAPGTASLEGAENPILVQPIDWAEKLKRYDSFLGGFALMRLAGEEYMNYSEHYFSTLSLFNDAIKSDVKIAGRSIDRRYHDAFIGESSFKTLYPYLNKVVEENDLYQVAKLENQTISKSGITRIIELNNLERSTYMVAVLLSYGVGDEARRKKIDGLILSNFKDEIKKDTSEAVALCYGLNRGYSVFSNRYKLHEKEKIVKFELKSQVDYYTIESIYQYVFNNCVAEGFPYLDSWCPKYSKRGYTIKKTDYLVLDTLVKGKKKPKVLSAEYLASLLQSFFSKETEIYFRAFVEKLRFTIYNDTLEEIEDELAVKNNEIHQLKIEIEKLKSLDSEIPKTLSEGKSITKSRRKSKGSIDKTESKLGFED